jgi:hypothetical protein
MIKGFRCRETERLFGDQSVSRFRAIERAACRKLLLRIGPPVWMISARISPMARLSADFSRCDE